MPGRAPRALGAGAGTGSVAIHTTLETPERRPVTWGEARPEGSTQAAAAVDIHTACQLPDIPLKKNLCQLSVIVLSNLVRIKWVFTAIFLLLLLLVQLRARAW